MRKIKHLLYLTVLCLFTACAVTGCGTSTANSTSGNNNTDKNELSEDVENAADNVVNGAKDVAEDIGDATDDLLGSGGFRTYSDAHDYFLDTMSSYHSDAKFELHDEDKELNDYQEGSKGYHFYLYDTSKDSSGDMFGEFYVDANSGRIYKRVDDDTVEEYPSSSNSAYNNSGSSRVIGRNRTSVR